MPLSTHHSSNNCTPKERNEFGSLNDMTDFNFDTAKLEHKQGQSLLKELKLSEFGSGI